MNAAKFEIFVFCALPCEARPLIETWRLKKHQAGGRQSFALYASDERAVVITGIGKVAMAGAVAYTMAGFQASQSPVLLNVGIAGHADAPLGMAYLAHQMIDAESGRRFYPQQAFPLRCDSQVLLTHARPQTSYPSNALVDMEGAGFYEMASKFTTCELIQVLKIVSDNRVSPATRIDSATVSHWIGQRLDVLEDLITSLQALRQTVQSVESGIYEQLVAEYRFTVAGAIKLKRLLQRWRVVKNVDLDLMAQQRFKDGKALMAWLEQALDSSEFYL